MRKVEKVKFYTPIKEEAGVIMAFVKLHEQLGFPKIVSSSARGFDISDIEYVDDKGIHRVVVEFEYLSSNYISHGHHNSMLDDKEYIVICWEDDCNLSKILYDNYKKSLYKIIELKNYVDILPDKENTSINDTKYYLINYNPSTADNRPISSWVHSNMYIFKNNNHIKVANGSKALIKQGKHIVGGFDIVRFENIELSKNSIELYKKLTDYPIRLFVSSYEEIKSEYIGNCIGHIFYDNFFELSNTNLIREVKEILPDLGISRGAIQTLTEEQYEKLLGLK